MKKTFLILTTLLCCNLIFGQEEESAPVSLIADIMNVAPVTEVMDATTMEADEEYKQQLEEEKAKLDEELKKVGEDFKGEVSKVIENFNEVLEKGVRKEVTAEEKKVATNVHALSMSLLKNEKKVIMDFNTRVTTLIRKLPTTLTMDKEKELKEMINNYRTKFDEELQMNKDVVEAFKATEHLLESEESKADDDSEDQQ